MKYLTFCLLTLTIFCSYGQEKNTDVKHSEFKRVQIGFNVSPDICYRTLKNTNGSSLSDSNIEQRNNRETIKLGYTAGLNVCFNINKSIGLKTGVQYSNKGYQTKFQDLIFEQPDPSLPNKVKFIYNFHYIDIPVKANFTIGNKKRFSFFTSAGIITNILIKESQTVVSEYSDRTDRKIESTNYGYNKLNISPAISIGVDYKINTKMNLRIEPTFRYGVLKLIDASVTTYLYSGGININYYFGI